MDIAMTRSLVEIIAASGTYYSHTVLATIAKFCRQFCVKIIYLFLDSRTHRFTTNAEGKSNG